MRPISIINFERCYLGAIIIGLINSAILIPTMLRTPQLAQAATMLGSNILYGSILVGVVITLLLWYFAARRASNVAKWIIVVFFALGALGMIRNLFTGFAGLPAGPSAVIAIVAFVLQAAAVYLLFKPDAAAWFRREQTDLRGTFE